MSYDLIIVSQSKGDLIQVTQNCIDSARADGAELNIIIVETYQVHEYIGIDENILYSQEFNYNKCLNLGLSKAKNEIQILANNDIIFKEGWSKIGDIMKANNILSASALSNDIRQRDFSKGDHTYEGYEIGYQLTGWCIFAQKELWSRIGRLNESYQFWFSDNTYAKQLKQKGILHYLICSIQVDHIGSRTLITQDRMTQRRYTFSQGKGIREFR